jgi:hypothetical protein
MTRYWYIQTDIEYRKKIDNLRKEKSKLDKTEASCSIEKINLRNERRKKNEQM